MNNEDGIYSQIKNQIPYSYHSLTYEELKKTVNEIVNSIYTPKKDIIIHTGLYGWYNFNFISGQIGLPDGKYYIETFNKDIKIIYVTMGRKESNWKVKVRMWKEFSKLELFWGTRLIFTCNKFDDINKYLKNQIWMGKYI